MAPFVGYGCKPGENDSAKIDEYQLRATNHLSNPKSATEYRIFLTGGSTAFSSGAPDNSKTIGGFLEYFLNAKPQGGRVYAVYTMATPAWASTHERIMIENRLLDFDPDLVISLSGNNDVHWGVMGQNILWFRTYADNYYWTLLNRLQKAAGLGAMQDIILKNNNPIPPKVVGERLLRNIRLSHFALSTRKTPYIFLLQPTLALTNKELSLREKSFINDKKEYFRQCYYEINHLLVDLDLPNFTFNNLATLFDGTKADEEIFLDSYHFGDRGNKMIAENIYNLLIENSLLH